MGYIRPLTLLNQYAVAMSAVYKKPQTVEE